MPGRFVRRLAVKGHHGRRHAGTAAQLRAPPVTHRCHLDLVRAATDGLFEVMNDHLCVVRKNGEVTTILFATVSQSSEGTREARLHRSHCEGSLATRAEKNFAVWFSTGFTRTMHRISTARALRGRYNTNSRLMTLRVAALLAFVSLAMVPSVHAASDATLFRLFFLDGTSVVSFGEFTRLDDQVIFSMPLGGSADQPRLHVVTLAASQIDWARTDRYAASARYQRYAETRGDDDFQILSSDIARVLNEVALSPDKNAALSRAEQARRTLADWPAAHYGYRQRDVSEVVSLLDEAISDLRASAGRDDFSLALVATPVETGYEPLLPPQTIAEQIEATFRVAYLSPRVADRVSLLQEALALIAEAGKTIPSKELSRLRHAAEDRIRNEREVDERYEAMSQRLLASASSAAGRARIADVERVLTRVSKEDERLGGRRPEVVQALSTALHAQLEDARRLRLLLDQWQVRRTTYRTYQRTVRRELTQLTKTQSALEAIRRFEGPSPTTLVALRSRLAGGADRLQRMSVPDYIRPTHELLVSAWRFAESAVDIRYSAVSSGDVGIAWQASSSAAAAVLMLNRAESEIKTLADPPRLQ